MDEAVPNPKLPIQVQMALTYHTGLLQRANTKLDQFRQLKNAYDDQAATVLKKLDALSKDAGIGRSNTVGLKQVPQLNWIFEKALGLKAKDMMFDTATLLQKTQEDKRNSLLYENPELKNLQSLLGEYTLSLQAYNDTLANHPDPASFEETDSTNELRKRMDGLAGTCLLQMEELDKQKYDTDSAMKEWDSMVQTMVDKTATIKRTTAIIQTVEEPVVFFMTTIICCLVLSMLGHHIWTTVLSIARATNLTHYDLSYGLYLLAFSLIPLCNFQIAVFYIYHHLYKTSTYFLVQRKPTFVAVAVYSALCLSCLAVRVGVEMLYRKLVLGAFFFLSTSTLFCLYSLAFLFIWYTTDIVLKRLSKKASVPFFKTIYGSRLMYFSISLLLFISLTLFLIDIAPHVTRYRMNNASTSHLSRWATYVLA
ncbi:hypothetical protein NEDG_00074 [Nematocida displodere]|uniref:Uncharacterized protein n=1 Tax=Nematocida displodere TaxID=1805483 RepID=A0A177EKU0_9MICR|nr:hypothetical protein NEDG_00074 [Nematocida displodere]